jgi:hypothetical protein
MIHWEWVEVQVSHTMSSVSHSMDTVVINDSLRVGWGTNLPHRVFCIPFHGYCCDQWFIESGLRYKSPTPCFLINDSLRVGWGTSLPHRVFWSMIHWEWVEVQVSHTVSFVSHSIDTVVIYNMLRESGEKCPVAMFTVSRWMDTAVITNILRHSGCRISLALCIPYLAQLIRL